MASAPATTAKILSLTALMLSTSACTTLQGITDRVRDVLGGEPKRSETSVSKPTVIAQDQNIGKENQFKVESWSLTPQNPVPGETMTSEISITAYSAKTRSPIELTIQRTLRINREKIPLGPPKTEEHTQGQIKLLWSFTLPVDADPGKYALETKVSSKGKSETLENQFRVK